FVTSFISGSLYQSWSDKLSLLKKEMASRNIDMPEVVTKEQFIEEGAKAFNMSISQFEKQFNLKAENLDWISIKQSFTEIATNKGINITNVHFPFSKNEYFTLAEQKLGMGHWEMVDMLWQNYNPNKIWYVIVGIGIFSIISLSIYDRLIIKPLEKKNLNRH